MRKNGNAPAVLSEKTLWRRSVSADAAEDEPARMLDLAGFADGTLDADDRERVAHWLTRDAAAAADVAAARASAALASSVAPAPETVVARALALVHDDARADNVVAFRSRHRPRLRGMAEWGSLAAAVAMAAWLGLTLGVNTSRAFVSARPSPAQSFLGALLDTQAPLLGPPGDSPLT